MGYTPKIGNQRIGPRYRRLADRRRLDPPCIANVDRHRTLGFDRGVLYRNLSRRAHISTAVIVCTHILWRAMLTERRRSDPRMVDYRDGSRLTNWARPTRSFAARTWSVAGPKACNSVADQESPLNPIFRTYIPGVRPTIGVRRSFENPRDQVTLRRTDRGFLDVSLVFDISYSQIHT